MFMKAHWRPRCPTLSSHFSSHSFNTSKIPNSNKNTCIYQTVDPLLSSILCADLKPF